ncbi:MAG: hypothetical protein INR73_15840 [Williamsia sp.]|nr:hypothetical protein [Williamsia sp.]
MANPTNNSIRSLEDLRVEQQALRQRIRAREEVLRERISHVPGELFYSGVDNVLPGFIRGKVSSLALGAGRGLINSFFLKKSPVAFKGLKVLQAAKPSGLLRKAGGAIGSLFKKKRS